MIQKVLVWVEAFVPRNQLNKKQIRLKGNKTTKLH